MSRRIMFLLYLVLLISMLAACGPELPGLGGGGGGGGGGSAPPTENIALVWIEPWAGAEVAAGATTQLTATAIYYDGQEKSITNWATWTSDDDTVATVNGKGVVTGVGEGSTYVNAEYGGVTGWTWVDVTVTLESLEVTPATATIQETTTQQFTATGSYSDGSTRDITDSVTWTTSNAAIAFISNATGFEGIATGMSAGGPVTITASFNGISDTASLTVTPPLPELSVRVTSVVDQGASVLVSYTVENNGLANATAFDVDVWANATTAPVVGDVGDNSNSHTALDAGATLSDSVTITTSSDAGTAYAVVDGGEAVTESDETNNVSAGFTWPFGGYSCADVTEKLGGTCTDITNGFELNAPVGGSLTFGGYGFDDNSWDYATENICALALFGDGGVVLLEATASSYQTNGGPYEEHWAGDSWYCDNGRSYDAEMIPAGEVIDWTSYATGNCSSYTDTDAGLTKLNCVYP